MTGIVTYFDQLAAKADRIPADDPRRIMLRAFRHAGVPTSTFYRAQMGAELKGETASKVAAVLDQWAHNDEGHDERSHAAA